MTFYRLQKNVFTALRDPTGYDDDTKLEFIKEWLNKAEQKICAATDYYVVTSSTITSVSDQQEYALPTGTKSILAATYNNNRIYPIDMMKTIGDSSPGTPSHFYVRTKYIGLYPIPEEDDNVIKIWYVSIGGNMSDNNDEPVIPEEWQMGLVYYAALHYALEMDDTRTAIFAQLWKEELKNAIEQATLNEYAAELPEIDPVIQEYHYRDEN